MKRLSKWFYLSPGIASGVFNAAMLPTLFWFFKSTVGFIESGNGNIWGILMMFLITFLASAFAYWYLVAYCIVLYKAWASLSSGNPRTTPGKAVGFTFIPYFNLYWQFQAVWGFAKDYNSYVSSLNQDSFRINQRLFLWDCIIPIISVAVVFVVYPTLLTLLIMSDFFSTAVHSFSSVVVIFLIPLFMLSFVATIIQLLVMNATCDAVNNLVAVANNESQ